MLVVEDDVPSGQALKMLLKFQGYDADIVSTLAQAMANLDHGAPSMIILDLMLPDGDGAEVLRRVRSASIPVRVAVTTAVSDPNRLNEVLSLGPDCMLRKPIDFDALLRCLVTH